MIEYKGAYIYKYGEPNDYDPIEGMYYVSVPVFRLRAGITEYYYLCRDLKTRGSTLDVDELTRTRKLREPTPLLLLQAPRSGYFDNEEQAKLFVRLWLKRQPDGRGTSDT